MKNSILILLTLIFISQYTRGAWEWVDKPAADAQELIGNSKISSLTTTQNGTTYATGYFTQKARFQNYTLTALDAHNPTPFLIKYDITGKVIWALSLPVSIKGVGNSIAIDQQENIYVAGTFSGKITFNPLKSLQSVKENSLFLAKYNKDGTFLWAQVGESLTPNGVALDKDGFVYLVGSFQGKQQLGGLLLESGGSVDIFIAKYNNFGQMLWAQAAGSSGYDVGNAIAVNSYGDIFITGSVSKGLVRFESQTINNTNGNQRSVFLTKYEPQGGLKWARIESSAEPNNEAVSEGYGVVCDELDGCYVTGSFNFDLQLEVFYGLQSPSIQLLADADKDIFVTKYSSEGVVYWAKKAGGSTSANNFELNLVDDEAFAITIDKSGNKNILITGYFESDSSFDNVQLQNTGDKDIFVASYNRDTGQLVYAKAVGSNDTYSAAVGYSISSDASNNFYLGGRFNTDQLSAIYFAPISLTSNEGLYDAYVAKYFGLMPTITKPVYRPFPQIQFY